MAPAALAIVCISASPNFHRQSNILIGKYILVCKNQGEMIIKKAKKDTGPSFLEFKVKIPLIKFISE